MKHDQLIIKISKLILMFWLIFSISVSIIIKQTINFKDIYLSIIVYSVIFIPIYLAFFSLPLNKQYLKRIIKSLLALIPILFSYYLLSKQIFYINYNVTYIFVSLLIILLLNFSLTDNNNNLFLFILTLFFTFSSLIIKFVQGNSISNFSIKNYEYQNVLIYSSLFIIIITGIIITFIYHLFSVNKLRKENIRCLK